MFTINHTTSAGWFAAEHAARAARQLSPWGNLGEELAARALQAGYEPGDGYGDNGGIQEHSDPRLLNEVTKFGYRGVKYLNSIVWLVDDQAKYTGPGVNEKGQITFTYGATGGGEDGSLVVVYIHPSVLNDANLLYLTVGHELIHANLRASGMFFDWFYYDDEGAYAQVASEYLAWRWTAEQGEKANFLSPGLRVESYLRAVESLGLRNIILNLNINDY